MVGGGDDGSDIVADIRTMEDQLYDAETDLFDGIKNLRSRAHVEGWSEDSLASIDADEIAAKKRVDEIRHLDKQASANARLIAAAPEMYKILREVLIDYKSDAKIEGRDLPLTGKMIREVLAKVDGG
jgi:septation ring formation regulator EzrA